EYRANGAIERRRSARRWPCRFSPTQASSRGGTEGRPGVGRTDEEPVTIGDDRGRPASACCGLIRGRPPYQSRRHSFGEEVMDHARRAVRRRRVAVLPTLALIFAQPAGAATSDALRAALAYA